MASFSFSFAGDDIDGADEHPAPELEIEASQPATASAFPVPGKPQLPPTSHRLADMLAQLPSKIAYSLLNVTLDGGEVVEIPRRELWDVRVQLMAEDDDAAEGPEGLGSHDVKTGVYEGGFKSWESSVDLVKVLDSEKLLSPARPRTLRVIELGCGTALPSLAIFRSAAVTSSVSSPLSIVLADYNPSVLQLVTLPNFILTWALARKTATPVLETAFYEEGELELTPEVIAAFEAFLASSNISLRFLSGGWSQELVELLYGSDVASHSASGEFDSLLIGAETIYSPFALDAFNEMVLAILSREKAERAGCKCQALVGAKRLYFGVGGSLDDFIAKARGKGAVVTQLREEAEGVRRGVVRCVLPAPSA
ncbi:Histidine protein methyltransferase 1 like [Verticillium longisporum]|uniref:Histidine protein methyltransferase 1 like n=1 Tax=Verticillium longisporum TaxID=100787 RepID=A0A8I2ZIT8_VERLO|nr:Histidine protein methyltransferase 1 like [Verticillium longisporum]